MARRGLAMAQQDVGDRLTPPLDYPAVSGWERGVTRPALERVAQLAQAVGMPKEYLCPLPCSV